MKNSFLFKIKSSITLNIKGKNINRFLNKLIKNNIEILEVNNISYKEVNIRVYKSDIETIYKLKTVYDLNEINQSGLIKIKKIINVNKILLFFLFLGIIGLVILTNIIFDVEVVHNKKEIQELLISELKKYNISKYNFVKSFNDVENIKKEILNKYKDKLEWIEIERVGTKYIIRVEERKIPLNIEDGQNRDVVAKKSAIIKTIIADNGVVVKNINDYVKKGDVIVSGSIYLNESLKSVISANAKVYGEVWYKTNVEIPFIYYEENYTSNINKVLTLKFLNKRFELFNFHKYENKKIEEMNIVKHLFLPISFVLETQREIKKTDKIYTIDEAIDIAKQKSIDAINSKLNDKEYIISSKNLKVEIKESKIVLEMFFSVYEDITDYRVIEDINYQE